MFMLAALILISFHALQGTNKYIYIECMHLCMYVCVRIPVVTVCLCLSVY